MFSPSLAILIFLGCTYGGGILMAMTLEGMSYDEAHEFFVQSFLHVLGL